MSRLELCEVSSCSVDCPLCTQPSTIAQLNGGEQGAHFLKNVVSKALSCQPTKGTPNWYGPYTTIRFVKAKQTGTKEVGADCSRDFTTDHQGDKIR